MKHIVMTLYMFALFLVLVPNVLVHLPKNGSKMITAGVHALIFALVWQFTHHYVYVTFDGVVENLVAVKHKGQSNKGKKASNSDVKHPTKSK